MLIKFNKFKILKKFNLYTLYEFTTKINIYYNKYNRYKLYKLPKIIKVLKILYKLNKKKIKHYLNKFTITNLLHLLKILKSRLDYILFNSNFFLTINQVRQFILHKYILINNKIIINCNYNIKKSSIICICNTPINLLKNILIYNYIIKYINTKTTNDKITKLMKLFKNEYTSKIIQNFNKDIFTITTCYKNFKLKINYFNNTNSLLYDNILNTY